MKVRMSTFILLLLFQSTFISIKYIPNYDYVRYFSILVIGVYLLKRISIYSLKRILKNNVVLIAFVVSLIYSSWHSGEGHTFVSGILYGFQIIEMFVLLEDFGSNGEKFRVIDILHKFFAFYLVVTDIILLLIPGLVEKFEGYYLIGNKFSVAYLHMFFIALFYIRNTLMEKKRWFVNICGCSLFILSFGIAFYTECATGMMGIIILFILINANIAVKKILVSPYVAIVTLIFCDFVLFISDTVLNNKYLIYVVENIFQKDMGLNGRLVIYESIFEVIKKSPIFGFGYNRAYETLMNSISAVNAQNALLNNIVNYGIVGTILIIALVFNVFRKAKKLKHTFPLIAVLYVFFVLSCIEITLEHTFLTILAVICLCISENEGIRKGSV